MNLMRLTFLKNKKIHRNRKYMVENMLNMKLIVKYTKLNRCHLLSNLGIHGHIWIKKFLITILIAYPNSNMHCIFSVTLVIIYKVHITCYSLSWTLIFCDKCKLREHSSKEQMFKKLNKNHDTLQKQYF